MKAPFPEIHNESCDCAVGKCAEGLDRDQLCINRKTGIVHTAACAKCGGNTWHQDGNCLRCETSNVDLGQSTTTEK